MIIQNNTYHQYRHFFCAHIDKWVQEHFNFPDSSYVDFTIGPLDKLKLGARSACHNRKGNCHYPRHKKRNSFLGRPPPLTDLPRPECRMKWGRAASLLMSKLANWRTALQECYLLFMLYCCLLCGCQAGLVPLGGKQTRGDPQPNT